MPFAQYDESGIINGFYVESAAPEGAQVIDITLEQWQACIESPGAYVVKSGKLANAPPPSAAEAQAEQQAIQSQVIAGRRYQAESAGILINGMAVATDRDSQALITGAALAASLDDTYTCNWKTGEGFVLLDAKTLLVIAKTVRAHVQACFDREAELLAAVKGGSYTDAMLEQGWPS